MATYDLSVIEKIKKLFALGSSSNAHEASLAMEMAQRLMAKHNLTAEQVEVGDIVEEAVKSIATATKCKGWELRLYDGVAKAFGCGLLFQRGYPYARYLFVGPKAESQLAVYAATFLSRLLTKARAAYTQTLAWNLDRQTKTREIDAYCSGWVTVALTKVTPLVPRPVVQTAIAKHVIAVKTGDAKVQQRQGGSQNALMHGAADANAVSLNKPMTSAETTARQLGEGSGK